MLVLTRSPQKNEIIFGDNLIRIKILSARRSEVKLGIDAPIGLTVYREELFYKAKNNANKNMISNGSLMSKIEKSDECVS